MVSVIEIAATVAPRLLSFWVLFCLPPPFSDDTNSLVFNMEGTESMIFDLFLSQHCKGCSCCRFLFDLVLKKSF